MKTIYQIKDDINFYKALEFLSILNDLDRDEIIEIKEKFDRYVKSNNLFQNFSGAAIHAISDCLKKSSEY